METEGDALQEEDMEHWVILAMDSGESIMDPEEFIRVAKIIESGGVITNPQAEETCRRIRAMNERDRLRKADPFNRIQTQPDHGAEFYL